MKKFFKIVKDSSPSLRQKSEEVKEITPEIIDFVNQMHDYLVASQDEEISKKYNLREGVGLAAPQTGRNIRAHRFFGRVIWIWEGTIDECFSFFWFHIIILHTFS